MRDPDMQGRTGRAWQIKVLSDVPAHQAHVAGYLVFAPHSHPIWPWHVVSVVSLRDIPGVKPAHKQYLNAEFEFIIFAVNPELCPTPDPDKPPWPQLEPLDFVGQFHGVTEAQAQRLCAQAVTNMVSGGIQPDSDYRRAWGRWLVAAVDAVKQDAL